MFELNEAILAITSFKYPHTTNAIVKCIEDVLEHWNLKNKVFSITTDSEANVKSACNKLGIKWIPCFAHILNLIVQKGLLPAKHLITWMKRLIKFFTAPKQSKRLEAVQVSIQAQHQLNREKSEDNILVQAQNDIVTHWNSTYNAWVQMLKLKPYIEILASSLTVQQEKDAIADGKRLKAIIITEDVWTAVANIISILKTFNDITNYISGSSYPTMSIIYPTMSTLQNALLKEFEDEDDSTDEPTDFNTSLINDCINIFDNKEISDEDEDAEEFKTLAVMTDLVKSIKKIMSKLFEKYYKFSDDEILFTATAIDSRGKNFEYESASLACQDYLKLEYDQMISDEDLESLSNEVTLDLSGSFISTVFMAVQKNLINKNEINQYFIMEMIGPLDNPLQW